MAMTFEKAEVLQAKAPQAAEALQPTKHLLHIVYSHPLLLFLLENTICNRSGYHHASRLISSVTLIFLCL